MEPESTHPDLRRAIEYLAANCDGAHERDKVGFSKADAAYGHRMAVELEMRELDGDEQIVIREILVKYTTTQLEGAGIQIPDEASLRTWLGPGWTGVDAGTETRSRVLERLRRAEEDRKPKPPELHIETSKYSPNLLIVTIGRKEPRFYDILNAIKSLSRDDREYRPSLKAWAVEGYAAARLAEALGEFRVNWSEAAAEVRDRALAAPPVVATPEPPAVGEGSQHEEVSRPEPSVTVALSGSRVLVAFGGCTRERMFNHIASVKAIPGARFVNQPTKHWEVSIDRVRDVLGAFPEAAGAQALRDYLLSLDAGQAAAEAARIERLARLNASLDARIAGPAVGHTLRHFQVDGIRFVFDCLDRDGARGALLGDDMGLGKTLEGLVIADELRKEHGATIFALTKASCLDNWSIEAAREKIPAEIFSHDFRKIPEPLDSGKYVVLIDECFPGETLVETDEGSRSIAEIVDGKLPLSVWSFDTERQCLELKPVVRYVKKRLVGDLYQVHHEHGSFKATGNHRIWTEEHGYREVRALEGGETLRVLEVREGVSSTHERSDGSILQPFVRDVGAQQKEGGANLRVLGMPESISHTYERCGYSALLHPFVREDGLQADSGISGGAQPPESKASDNEGVRGMRRSIRVSVTRKKERRSSLLRHSLLGAVAQQDTGGGRSVSEADISLPWQYQGQAAPNCFRTDASPKSDERSSDPRKDAEQARGANFPGQGWERDGFKAAVGSLGVYWSASRGEHQDRAGQGPVYVAASGIQGGSRRCAIEDRNRDRWQVPSASEVEIPRSTQDRSLGSSRVVRIEVLERRSRLGTGESGQGDTVVYNLEVDGHHNYIANGVLVSNCHSFKNPAAKKTAALLKLVEHPNCIAAIPMSGTLNENGRPQEFFIPLRVINHDLGRDEKAFKKRYCNASTTSIKHKRFGRIDHERKNSAGAAHLIELHRRIKPYFLRRMKTDPDIGIELPDKTRIFQEWSPTPEVDAEYRRELGRLRQIYEAKVEESEVRRAQAAVLRATLEQERSVGTFGIDEWVQWAAAARLDEEGVGLTVLDAARRSGLVGDDTLARLAFALDADSLAREREHFAVEDTAWVLETANELMAGTISREGAALVALTHARHAASRAKVSSAIELTDELISQGRRPVVFFDFADTAKTFAEHYGVPCLTGESGSVGRDGELGERQQMCQDFNEGRFPVFVGTIKAGGEGLNLTGGSDCLLVDRAWTPGKAVQAEDRIWRIGQTRNVFSFWVQAFGIDKKIDERLLLKQEFIEQMYTGQVRTLEGFEMSALDVLDSVLREVDGRGISRPRGEGLDIDMAAQLPLDGGVADVTPVREPVVSTPVDDVEPSVRVEPLMAAGTEEPAASTQPGPETREPARTEAPAQSPDLALREVASSATVPSPAPVPDRIAIAGSECPFEPGLAAILSAPRLQAPDGARSLDAFVVREQYPHAGGTLAVIENPAAKDAGDDRLALVDIRIVGHGICQVVTKFVADGAGTRFAFDAASARVALPDPVEVRSGAASVPAECPALLESVRQMVPELSAGSLLGRFIDPTGELPVTHAVNAGVLTPACVAPEATRAANDNSSQSAPARGAQLGLGI